MTKEQEAMTIMEKQFKRGEVSAEAMALLEVLKEKLDAFSFGEASSVCLRVASEHY